MNILIYGTENSGNLGSIIRTSVVFGLKRLYLFDQFELLKNDSALDRANEVSLGHIKEIEIIPVENPVLFVREYPHAFATTLAKGSKRIGDPDFDIKFLLDVLILFGNETTGLPRELSRSHNIQKIVVPTKGMDYCLSLPVAFGIVLYDYLKQHPEEFPQRGK